MNPRRPTPRPPQLDPILGLGAGGHAKCVVDAIRSVPRFRIAGLLDDDPLRHGRRLLGHPVLGGPDLLAALLARGVRHAFVGVGGAGEADARRRAFAVLHEAGLDLPVLVHRSGTVSPFARLAEGVQVLAGGIVNADAALGAGAIVNAGAIVGHDCRVGAHAHVASGARLGGEARVGPGAHVGAGAVLLNGRAVGADAIVGAGAVVSRDVPAGARVAGNPARALALAGAV
jgi:UDP-perosamine 4-acetyltransferase